MKVCRQYKKDWPAFLSGQLSPERIEEMAAHLETCPVCRTGLEETRKLVALTRGFKEELNRVMSTVDWESLPGEITEKIWEQKERKTQPETSSRQRLWKWQPVAAGLFLGLLLGGTMTYLVFRPQKPAQVADRQEAAIAMPADMMERVDVALARRETIDYLERSQYLLLDLLQNGRSGESSLVRQERIQQLLTEKKYLNDQLDDWRLMKARAICDQIELLFLELSQLSPELSARELDKIREMVEDKQLLLKINLVKKELQQGEV
ncbi:MAG: zf-HC2 domain-containing protein [Candidatus Saccharicenans sp.]|nr:zf-HC2 domain-containing protein [Candidatus Saccharicenans sp.]